MQERAPNQSTVKEVICYFIHVTGMLHGLTQAS